MYASSILALRGAYLSIFEGKWNNQTPQRKIFIAFVAAPRGLIKKEISTRSVRQQKISSKRGQWLWWCDSWHYVWSHNGCWIMATSGSTTATWTASTKRATGSATHGQTSQRTRLGVMPLGFEKEIILYVHWNPKNLQKVTLFAVPLKSSKVFYRGLRRNNFYSPRVAEDTGRLGRLRFTYKGNLELFSLVSNKWTRIWKSDTSDTEASKVWEAVLLPEASAQLRFESTTWGAVGSIMVDRRRLRFRNLKTAVSASLWSQVHFTHGPSTRRWHTAVLDAGKMWIFAGDDGELKNDLWYYNTVTMDGWVDVSESGLWPSPRFSHMAAMQGRYMWVFGGVVQSSLSKELWNYNMDNGNWSIWSNLQGPTARESMTLVDLENRLWMFGGYDGSIRNDLWYLTTGPYDPFWTLITPSTSPGPSGRYSHDAIQSAGKLWIFGGLTQEGLKNDLWYFDIPSNTWSQIENNGPSARESATAVVFKGSMWLFGGIDVKNQSDEVWKLDLPDLQSENAESDAWRLLDSGTGPNGRRFHVSVLDEEGRMWCHNGELWYFETRTSTTTTQSSTRTSTSQTTTETTSTSTSSTSSSSSTTGTTTTITSTSTTISTTTSTSSSSTTSTTKSTTSSSTSTRTSTTSSTSNSSTSSTTSISTTTSQTSTSSSSTSSSSTSRTTTTTSSSSTSRTTTTSSTTSSSTSKTTTTSSTSRTSTSSTTISQTSTTSLTSTTSNTNTSTTTTKTTTSSSTSTETTTSSSKTWTSTTSSFTETTLTFWNTITSSTTTQVIWLHWRSSNN